MMKNATNSGKRGFAARQTRYVSAGLALLGLTGFLAATLAVAAPASAQAGTRQRVPAVLNRGDNQRDADSRNRTSNLTNRWNPRNDDRRDDRKDDRKDRKDDRKDDWRDDRNDRGDRSDRWTPRRNNRDRNDRIRDERNDHDGFRYDRDHDGTPDRYDKFPLDYRRH